MAQELEKYKQLNTLDKFEPFAHQIIHAAFGCVPEGVKDYIITIDIAREFCERSRKISSILKELGKAKRPFAVTDNANGGFMQQLHTILDQVDELRFQIVSQAGYADNPELRQWLRNN